MQNIPIKHPILNTKKFSWCHICVPHYQKKNFNWLSCHAHLNNLLSNANNLKLCWYAIEAQKEATQQMLHCKEMYPKRVAAWGKWPFTSSIQITFLKHVEEALAHPYHTQIFTFANQMSRLEKAELSWPFKELTSCVSESWDMPEQELEKQPPLSPHTHTHIYI